MKFNIYCNGELVDEIEAESEKIALHFATIGAKWSVKEKGDDEDDK